MSCEDCEKIQKDNELGKNLAYFRVDNGNVLVGACDVHFNMIRAKVMSAKDGKREVMRINFNEQYSQDKFEKLEADLCRYLDEMVYLPIKEELEQKNVTHSLGFKKELFKQKIAELIKNTRE